jgi:transcriptional regulator with XRE-family HTH domain
MPTKKAESPNPTRPPRTTPPSARWLQARRVDLGYTQMQLAEETGIPVRVIRSWEKRGIPLRGTGAERIEGALANLARKGGNQEAYIIDKRGYVLPIKSIEKRKGQRKVS